VKTTLLYASRATVFTCTSLGASWFSRKGNVTVTDPVTVSHELKKVKERKEDHDGPRRAIH
jgi:hypothetical protein